MFAVFGDMIFEMLNKGILLAKKSTSQMQAGSDPIINLGRISLGTPSPEQSGVDKN